MDFILYKDEKILSRVILGHCYRRSTVGFTVKCWNLGAEFEFCAHFTLIPIGKAGISLFSPYVQSSVALDSNKSRKRKIIYLKPWRRQWENIPLSDDNSSNAKFIDIKLNLWGVMNSLSWRNMILAEEEEVYL